MKIVWSAMRLSLTVVCAICAPAAESVYPNHPVRMAVPFPPGATSDCLARAGTKAHRILGQQIVVDNRPGAGGLIGREMRDVEEIAFA